VAPDSQRSLQLTLGHKLTSWTFVCAEKEWEELWLQDDYEHEFYYVSQLFEHGWQPRSMT
jgi:hypothetical protein